MKNLFKPLKRKKEKPIYNHCLDCDSETLKQFKSCYEKDFVTAAALMPDAHLGYVAPIGSVLVTKDFIVPSWVGFDIGCGLIAVKLSPSSKSISSSELVKKVKSLSPKIYSAVQKAVPMGLGETNSKSAKHNLHEKTLSSLKNLIRKLESQEHDKSILQHIKQISAKHLGSLGSGNHFIELSTNEKQSELWIIIHSGSRGLGHKVAQKYMMKSSGSEKKAEYEQTHALSDKSQLGKEYLALLDFGLSYALLNRLEMSYRIQDAIESVLKTKLKSNLYTNKNHNHAISERGLYIHRKGATPAKKSERGIIPANMRDGSFLVEGLGNSKFLNSSSHGTGRQLSRKKAKLTISMSDFKSSMSGITGTISEKTLDEAPQAYKDTDQVMEAQSSSIKIKKHLLPLINWKGS